MSRPKVVIIGSGFGGLTAAKALRRADVDLLVLDKTNHHLFQPLLYQVATAALSPADIAVPIREILRHQANTTVIMAEAERIDPKNKIVVTGEWEKIPYDDLIVAVGGMHSYFGRDDWEPFAPGIKTLEDAIHIREKILMAFEHAERCHNSHEAKSYLRFIIIGGGPTGVEVAGAIAEIARQTLFKNFRKIKPEQSEIFLIEGANQVLPSYPPSLGGIAHRDLEKLGVNVMTSAKVTEVKADGVWIGATFIEARNIIWAAGNQASELIKTLGIPTDKQGRALVEKDLSIPGFPDVFVIGDAAYSTDKKGICLPGIAPVAIQQGRYVAKLIRKKIPMGKRPPFVYFDKGQMATIGRAKAVAVIGKLKLSGLIAWLAWSFIHIAYLINFKNRIIVMIEWSFWYLTGHRNVRLIVPPIEEEMKK